MVFRRLWSWLKSGPVEAPDEPFVYRVPDGFRYSIYSTVDDLVIHARDLLVQGGVAVELAPPVNAAKNIIDHDQIDRMLLKLPAATQRFAVDLRAALPSEVLKNTAVSLLIDHSGSMHGAPMICVAALTEAVTAALVDAGVAVDVLGFTTRTWRGGASRIRWEALGSPENPGRLCDLLHIIYRDAARPAGASDCHFEVMRMPQFLKENVDGEALQWAAARLDELPAQRKVLLVISDGAPVDDSTFVANSSDLLLLHLLQVIDEIEADGRITLGALGLNHRVDA